MNYIISRTALLLSFILFFNRAQGQETTRYTEKDYAGKTVWVQMMADTSANFFQVEKAFNTYFAHHERPAEAEEELGEHRKKEKYSKREVRRINTENKLRMDVKRYMLWHEQTLPYVQSDGRILTPTERLRIWQSQQQGR